MFFSRLYCTRTPKKKSTARLLGESGVESASNTDTSLKKNKNKQTMTNMQEEMTTHTTTTTAVQGGFLSVFITCKITEMTKLASFGFVFLFQA